MRVESELGFKQAQDLESQAEKRSCPGNSGHCKEAHPLFRDL